MVDCDHQINPRREPWNYAYKAGTHTQTAELSNCHWKTIARSNVANQWQ